VAGRRLAIPDWVGGTRHRHLGTTIGAYHPVMTKQQQTSILAPEMPYCEIPCQNGFSRMLAPKPPCQAAPLRIYKPLISRALLAIVRLCLDLLREFSLLSGSFVMTRPASAAIAAQWPRRRAHRGRGRGGSATISWPSMACSTVNGPRLRWRGRAARCWCCGRRPSSAPVRYARRRGGGRRSPPRPPGPG
jgi:hypothetical protein